MNKDRVDLGVQPLIKDEYVYEEVALYFATPATVGAPIANNTRRVLCTNPTDKVPFVLPRLAVLLGARVVPYPAGYSPAYTGDLTALERTALGAPRITLKRNTDTAAFAAAADNPIKIYAPTEVHPDGPGPDPDTIGLVTNELVIGLSKETIGAGTHYAIYGEGATLTNVGAGAETDALDMVRSVATVVYPHGTQAQSDAAMNAPGVIVGVFTNATAVALKYDVALVLHYRTTRGDFTHYGVFPSLDGKDDVPVPT